MKLLDTETVSERKGQTMLNVSRILFVAEPASVKVGPHRTDSTKLVLKSRHPECSVMLCEALGIEPGKQWAGANYFITEVGKQAFMAGLSNIAGALVEVDQQIADVAQIAAHLPEELAAPEKSGKCSDCGSSDGTHWGFCSHHYKN